MDLLNNMSGSAGCPFSVVQAKPEYEALPLASIEVLTSDSVHGQSRARGRNARYRRVNS